jgi:long-subunit fatty acid transport protein
MRKILTLIAGTMIAGNLLAGGLVTNTNQSATWVRMPSRNASTQIDAAYYNPAGLMKLDNGFHFSLNNQTISQKRTITSSYPYLNSGTYEGTVFAPLFPSVYAVYKLNKLAFSVGFMPIGGGGGATYESGLPSFEMSISDLVPSLASQGASAYDVDIFFEGSSLFLGYQGAISYKINDMISIAAGARYVTAKNTYTGHLQDVMVTMGGTPMPATTVFDGLVSNLNGIIGIPASLATAISSGFGTATLQNLVDASQMTLAQKAAIEAGLVAIGVPAAALPTMNLNTISGTVTTATPALTIQRNTASATSTLVADKTADVTQTGSGIAPFFSINISPIENLNIAIKYEMATKLELVNETAQDLLIGYTATGTPITQFPDGEKFRNDMPATLTIGAELKLSKITVAAGGNYYFDKSADYGHKWDDDLNSTTPTVFIPNSEIIENNGLALHAAAELSLSDKFLVSAGYAWANLGVNSAYQSDLTFANATSTIGLGAAYNITDKIRFNIGGAYTMYVENEKTVNHFLGATILFPTETYTKNTMMLGIGLDLNF